MGGIQHLLTRATDLSAISAAKELALTKNNKMPKKAANVIVVGRYCGKATKARDSAQTGGLESGFDRPRLGSGS